MRTGFDDTEELRTGGGTIFGSVMCSFELDDWRKSVAEHMPILIVPSSFEAKGERAGATCLRFACT